MSQSDGLSRPEQEGMRAVKLPSGATFMVHEKEVQYFRDRSKRYMSDNSFVNISDLQDIDRLLVSELLSHRYGVWVSQQVDYWGDPVDEKELHRALTDLSKEIRLIKGALGLDKKTRDQQRGEDSVENYLTQLRIRAREFGYVRNRQAAKAIELWKHLESLLTFHDNCDERERLEQKCRVEDILSWVRDEGIPSFNEIDEEFRQASQKSWIRKQ